MSAELVLTVMQLCIILGPDESNCDWKELLEQLKLECPNGYYDGKREICRECCKKTAIQYVRYADNKHYAHVKEKP